MKIFDFFYNIRIKRKLPNLRRFKIAKFLEVTGGKYIHFGNTFKAGALFRIEAIDYYAGTKYTPCIEIGDNADFGQSCHIGCIDKIRIGKNCLLGSKVLIIDHDHGDTNNFSNIPPGERKLYSKGPILIGDNVWIGDGAVILSNVNIGDNAVIGANSVVCKNVPPNTVVAGAPAKVIKRFDSLTPKDQLQQASQGND